MENLKMENLKMENCGRADSLQNEKHCFPTVFLLDESYLLIVGVALRLYFRREDIIRLYDTNRER